MGNRVNQNANGAADTYDYIASTNRISQVAGAHNITYTHDPAGNMIAAGTRTLVYNQDNRLSRVLENAYIPEISRHQAPKREDIK